MQDSTGATAACAALSRGLQQVNDFLVGREKEDAAQRAAVALAEVQLAEKARAADIAARVLLDELAVEDAKEEAQQKAKNTKKAKAKSKRSRATAGE